jgi:hypothetical protein
MKRQDGEHGTDGQGDEAEADKDAKDLELSMGLEHATATPLERVDLHDVNGILDRHYPRIRNDINKIKNTWSVFKERGTIRDRQ